MNKYHINLSKINWGSITLYSGIVMKIRNSTQGRGNTISMAEGIARKNENQAIEDIIVKAQNFDFNEDEIIFLPTFERITSLADLTIKLNEIGQ